MTTIKAIAILVAIATALQFLFAPMLLANKLRLDKFISQIKLKQIIVLTSVSIVLTNLFLLLEIRLHTAYIQQWIGQHCPSSMSLLAATVVVSISTVFSLYQGILAWNEFTALAQSGSVESGTTHEPIDVDVETAESK